MAHVVGEKGQVVIAHEIREKLGIRRGWRTVQRLVDDHVEIHFLPPPHDRSLRGGLKTDVRAWPADAEDWDGIREQAWREGAAGSAADQL